MNLCCLTYITTKLEKRKKKVGVVILLSDKVIAVQIILPGFFERLFPNEKEVNLSKGHNNLKYT